MSSLPPHTFRRSLNQRRILQHLPAMFDLPRTQTLTAGSCAAAEKDKSKQVSLKADCFMVFPFKPNDIFSNKA